MSDLERFNFMISKEVKSKLKEKADSMNISLSSYLRMILTAEIKK